MSVNVGVWANALMDRCGVFDPFWIYIRTAKSDQERILAGLAQYLADFTPILRVLQNALQADF